MVNSRTMVTASGKKKMNYDRLMRLCALFLAVELAVLALVGCEKDDTPLPIDEFSVVFRIPKTGNTADASRYQLHQDYLLPGEMGSDVLVGHDYSDETGKYVVFVAKLADGVSGQQKDWWFSLSVTHPTETKHYAWLQLDQSFQEGDWAGMPALENWVEVGPGKYVDMGEGEEWATCNEGAQLPHEAGNYYDFTTVAESQTPPSREAYKRLITSKYHWRWVSVQGRYGKAFVHKEQPERFLFFPAVGRKVLADGSMEWEERGFYCSEPWMDGETPRWFSLLLMEESIVSVSRFAADAAGYSLRLCRPAQP